MTSKDIITMSSVMGPQTDSSEGVFNLMALPAEIRMMVYSHIILPPFDISTAEQKAISKSEKARISAKRRKWHQTAQSLLLTCRWVNHEATPLFFRSKTVLLSRITYEDINFPPSDNPINSQRLAVKSNIRRLEFNLRIDPVIPTDDGRHTRNRLTKINQLLSRYVRYLPDIRTIVFRFVDVYKPRFVWLRPFLPYDTDLDIEFSLLRRTMATLNPNSGRWETLAPYRHADVGEFRQLVSGFNTYWYRLGYQHLSREKWASTETLFRSVIGGPELNIVVYELKYERRSPDDEDCKFLAEAARFYNGDMNDDDDDADDDDSSKTTKEE